MKPTEIRTLAKEITEDLFTNGEGVRAHRLVLEAYKTQDMGGWSEQAVQSRIEAIIRKRVEKKGRP